MRYYSIWFVENKILAYIRPWALVKVIDLLKVAYRPDEGPRETLSDNVN